MVVIIDYGAGNIESVRKAMEHIGVDVLVSSSPDDLKNADAAILPGVGSFGDAMHNIRKNGLESAIKDFISTGKPFLGICLGLQILFESSEESPGVKGLSVIKGKIVRIPDSENLKIPHMGWNSLDVAEGTRLFTGLEKESYVYFVHSYYLKCEEDVVAATTNYSTLIHASVEKDNLFACQFHPEKSGDVGIQILKNFMSIVKNS